MRDPLPPPNNPPESPVVWVAVDQALVTATGPDAVRFVDHFATAAISSLTAGQGTEAFFTDARGQVLALTTVLRTAAGLVIVAAPGQGPMLRDHLERYHIREAVTLTDASADVAAFLVAGPEAAATLAALGSPPAPQTSGDHLEATIGGVRVRVVRVTGQGADGFWLHCDRSEASSLGARLAARGLPGADPAAVEAARIEACFPLPADIVEKTLPQELGRDARGISFSKGCYLGQETVARLDAMGHVNRRLALVVVEADAPPSVPAAVMQADRSVGLLTSACRSPRYRKPVGLAILQNRALAGEPLRIGDAAARVARVAGQAEIPGRCDSGATP